MVAASSASAWVSRTANGVSIPVGAKLKSKSMVACNGSLSRRVFGATVLNFGTQVTRGYEIGCNDIIRFRGLIAVRRSLFWCLLAGIDFGSVGNEWELPSKMFQVGRSKVGSGA